MSSEYIDISTCPICKGRHRYNLDVKRALVMTLILGADMSERPRQRNFVRLFTCPKKNKEFQASFNLEDTSRDRISDVDVLGVGDDNGKD